MKIELIFYNTKTYVKASREILEEISDLLSFEPQGMEHVIRNMPAHIKWDGKKRLFSLKTKTFPTGLAGKVIAHLRAKGAEFRLSDKRDRPVSTYTLETNLPYAPRYYQTEIVETTAARPRGVIVAGTGAGKTLTAAMLIADKNVDTLFVTPDTGLKEQALKVFRKIFGEENVSGNIVSSAPVIVCNYQSLVTKDRKLFDRFRMLLIDEFHHSSSESYQKINMMASGAFYRYGFTGTFMRPDGDDMVMHGVLSSVLYEISTSRLIKEGFLVPPEINIIDFKVRKMSHMNYRTAYPTICKSLEFNQLVAKIANDKSLIEGKQTLVLVRLTEHGEILKRMIPSAVYLSGEMKMETREEYKRQFNNKEIRCMIATSVMGEGQDIPSIDVFINARLQASEIQTKQGIGRALRLAEGATDIVESKKLGKEKCEVYDFHITGHRNLNDHSIHRITQYSSEKAFKLTMLKNY